jgi:trimethylguanosine synthase
MEMKKLPKAIRRFYSKRTFLFSKYELGIKLDEESWYSVIPEVLNYNMIIKCISQYIADKVFNRVKQLNLKNVKVIDCFCGSGGLAIQLANRFPDFEAIDIDPM